MHGPKARSVPCGHVLIQRVHSFSSGHLAVFFVHVVRAGARVVADPDAEVFDAGGVFFVDLSHSSYISQSDPISLSRSPPLDVMFCAMNCERSVNVPH